VAGIVRAAAVAAVVAGGSARAQTDLTWTNFAGTSSNPALWSDQASWAGLSSPPVFTADMTLRFLASPLQPGPTFTATNDPNATVNRLEFGLDGYAFVPTTTATAAATLNISPGGIGATGLTLATSSGGAAPTIAQNGNGSVLLQQGGTSDAVTIQGNNNLLVTGTGLGVVKISAPITGSAGITVDFSPSAVKPFGSGGSLVLTGANMFSGGVILNRGDLAVGLASGVSGSPLGTGTLTINNFANNFRLVAPASAQTNPITLPNNVVLNGTMTISGQDQGGAAFTGAFSGPGGVTVNNWFNASGNGPYVPFLNFRGAAAFAGPLVVQPFLGGAGTGGAGAVAVSGPGTLATIDVRLFASGALVLDNTSLGNAAGPRLAANTVITSNRGSVALYASPTEASAETIPTLNAGGTTTLVAQPTSAGGATLTVTTLNRPQNGVLEFRGATFGAAPGPNVSTFVVTNNPGGATPGSATANTQNLSVLPYAYANLNPATVGFPTPDISLVRYDTATGRVLPLNTATEFASALDLTVAAAAPGLNYRIAGGATGGAVINSAAPVTVNGLLLTTASTSGAVNALAGVGGTAAVNMTGPIVAAVVPTNASGTALANSTTFLAPQIAVPAINFGSSPGYVISTGTLGAYLFIPGAIGGTGGLVKAGTSDVVLSGANTFTGGLTVNGGSVVFDNDNQLGAAGGAITLNAGAVDGLIYAPNARFGASAANGLTLSRPITLGPTGGTLSASNTNAPLTYTGALSGTGKLSVGNSAASVVVLNPSTNTATGDVTLLNGSAVVNSDAALGPGSNRLILNGGIFVPGAGYAATSRDVLVMGGAVYNSADFTLNGTLAMLPFSTQTIGAAAPGFLKIGPGNLTVTNPSTLLGTVTIGEATSSSGAARLATPAALRPGGTITLSGAGAMALASGFTLNDGAGLVLDNSAAVVGDRVGTVPVNLNGSALTLVGNAGANVTEAVQAVNAGASIGGANTLTLTQPASGGAGQVTTLVATGWATAATPVAPLSIGTASTLFVRGTNLGAATGDRTQFLVNAAVPTAGTVAVGMVAASSATSGPTDFAKAVAAGTQFSIVPFAAADYGSLAAPGATVVADQAGSVATLAGNASLNGLRIRDGGGVNLNGGVLTVGATNGSTTTPAVTQSGMILATGTANQGIAGPGSIEFGPAAARIVTATDLTIGSAAAPVALLSTGADFSTGLATGGLVKSGAGRLTLFGNSSTTLGTFLAGTTRGLASVTVAEGTLRLGNATALGTTPLSGVTGVNVLPSMSINVGATLDVNSLSLPINSVSGGGTLALGDGQVNLGTNSNFSGSITGTANSKFVIGYPQSAGTNTFGNSQNFALFGDNSGFQGQFQVLIGNLQVRSQNALGSGTSPILLGDTAGTRNAVILLGDAVTSVSRDITVQAGSTGNALIIGPSSGVTTLSGTITMNKNLALGGGAGVGAGLTGQLTVTGKITGPGQLILNPFVTAVTSGGSVAITNPANDYTGGTLANIGAGSNGANAVTAIVGVGADTALSTGPITLEQNAGMFRADGGARTLANQILIAPQITSLTATNRTVQWGFAGVNDFNLTGPVSSGLSQSLTANAAVNVDLNTVSTGVSTLAGTITEGNARVTTTFTKNGTGTVVFSGANNSFLGGLTVNAGVVGVGNNNVFGTAGPITVNGGTLRTFGGSWSVANALAGAGDLAVEAPNSALTLAGTGSTAGNLQVNTGTLKIGQPTTLSSLNAVQTRNVTAGTTVVAGGALDLNGQVPVNEVMTLNGTGAGGAGALVNTGAATARVGSGVASLSFASGGGGITASATNALTFTGGGGSGAAGTAVLGLTQASLLLNTPGSGYTGTPTVTISGGGGSGATATARVSGGQVTALTLTNPGSGYTSAPTITFSGGGSGATQATGAISSSQFQALSVTLTGDGSGYTSAPTVGFAAGGTAGVTANPAAVVLASNASIGGTGNLAIDGAVTGPGALTKVGPNTLFLNGLNTYAGPTTVVGGTLAGNGSLAGPVTVQPGAALKGGEGVGTLTVNGNVALTAAAGGGGATLVVDGTPTANSLIAVTGVANTFNLAGLGGDNALNFLLETSGLTPNTPYTWTVATTANPNGVLVNGVAATGQTINPSLYNVTAIGAGGLSGLSLAANPSSLVLSFTPVPEPSCVMLGCAMAAAAVAAVRRRRK
jgi:autotransporter-associated beta strand protein